MEPHVQFVTTSDGVRVAYAVAGSGPPLLWLFPVIGNHLQFELRSPVQSSLFEHLTRSWTLIMLDARGFGLSEDDVRDISVEAQLRDIDAVLGRLGISELLCSATEVSVPVAVSLAARDPARVKRLILINPFVSFAEYMHSPTYLAVMEAARQDPQVALEAWAANTAGATEQAGL